MKCLDDYSNNGRIKNGPYVGGKDEADEGDGLIDKWFYLSIGSFLIFAIKRTWGGVYFALVAMIVVRSWSSTN